jgi:hypothetical protein
MLARLRSRLSFANTISLIALFVALGGTGYAAVKLPKNSVGSTQIKRNAVSSSKVKNGTLRIVDFKRSELLSMSSLPGMKGEKGDKGDKGDNGTNGADGAPGTARAFARIDGNGALIGGADQNKGITASMVQHQNGASDGQTTGVGVYCFGGLGFTPNSAVVASDNTDTLPAVPAVQGGSLNFIPTAAVFKGEDLGRCDADHGQVRVAIERVDQTNPPELVNHGFFIWLEG